MPHAFDAIGFEELLDGLERVLAGALDHERRLTALADRVERHPPASLAGADDVTTLTATPLADLVGTPDPGAVRELCMAAREQRRLVEAMVARLAGHLRRPIAAPSRSVRVLAVDDSTDNRELVAALLEEAGFEVITARNGLEGVIAAHVLRPAVILMDFAMPVLDGVAAARLLKASASTRDGKILLWTAAPDVPVAGVFDGTLRKPSSPESVLKAVQRLLDDTR